MNNLLPNAVNMFLNGETKKRTFTVACIEAIPQCVFKC